MSPTGGTTEGAVAGVIRGQERLQKSERLLKRADFLRVQQKGERFATPRMVVLSMASPAGVRRFGVTVSRKVGHAPCRNRVKRRLREIYRRNKDRWPDGIDVVVIARAAAARAPFAELQNDLFRWADRVRSMSNPDAS